MASNGFQTGGQVIESPGSRKTTGGTDLPNTAQARANDSVVNANAPYKIPGEDVTGYRGVNADQRTWGASTLQPLPTGAGMAMLSEEEVAFAEGTDESESKVTSVNFEALTVSELHDELKSRNLSVEGKKADLVARLKDAVDKPPRDDTSDHSDDAPNQLGETPNDSGNGPADLPL